MPEPPPRPQPCDRDGDGYRATDCGGDDCNDADPTVHPGAPDLNAVAGPWTTTRVLTRAGGASGGTAVAVDRGGGVHLAYDGGPQAGLLYARRVGGGWQVESVDVPVESPPTATLAPRDRMPGIALDAAAVHLAYASPGGIRHAMRAGGTWVIEAVDPTGSGSTAIAIEPGGVTHLAYSAADGLRHATDRGGAWSVDLVDTVGAYPSMAVDATGALHLAYASGDQSQADLRYATGRAGAWHVETASDMRTGTPSIALDRAGLPRIAFTTQYVTDPGVHYLTRAASAWSDVLVPAREGVYATTLRLDARDEPHLLFSQLIDIFYSVRTPEAWQTERIAVLSSYDFQASFDLDAAATAHVAATSFFYPDNMEVEYGSNRQLQLDGVDQNCDGVDGVDADGDGHASLWTGGDDCDDDDPSSPFAAAGDGGSGCPPPP